MTDLIGTYETLETSELKQWYMNASQTRGCLGHKKCERNWDGFDVIFSQRIVNGDKG